MNRKVLLIGVGAAVAMIAIWFVLLWSPQGKKLDDARKRQEEAEETNSALALRLDRLRDLRARRPELQADLRALRAAVPKSAELDTFLLDTDAAAERAGVDITSVSPTKPAAAGEADTGATATTGGTGAAPPSAISVSLDASGGYFQILDFMNRLDDLPRIVVVDSLSLAGGGGDGDAAATGATSPSGLTMSITARMFTTEPPAAADGEAASTTTTTAPEGATAGGASQ